MQTDINDKDAVVHSTMTRNIEAPYNNNEIIFIKDFISVSNKINELREDGIRNFYVLADFDFTLTRKTFEGTKADNSFKTIENVFCCFYII